MEKKKIWLIAGGAILLVAVIVASVVRSFSGSAVDVKTAVAVKRVYEDKVLASGHVESVHPSNIVAPFGAQLMSLKVADGNQVVAGQPLGDLDVSENEKRVKEAAASLTVAEAELSQVRSPAKPGDLAAAQAAVQASIATADSGRKNAERYQYLFDNGAASPVDLETAKTAAVRAEADLQSAQGHLEALKSGDNMAVKVQQARVAQARTAYLNVQSDLAKCHITSPVAGLVLHTSVKEGDFLQLGMLIMTIGSPDGVQVVADLSEQDVGGVAPGQVVEIQWAGAPGKTFKGKVFRVSPTVSKSSTRDTDNVVRVEIAIDQGQGELKPGATVDATIYRLQPKNSLQVPNEALIGSGSNRTVYLAEHKVAIKRSVTVGHTNELFTEIVEGLQPGELVILNPQKMKDGQQVNPVGGAAK